MRVINLAKSGRSTRTFIGEGLWAAALQQKPELVLIQFGHNDSHGAGPSRGDRGGDHLPRFPAPLHRRDAGGRRDPPILVTPMCRRDFGPDGKLANGLLPYAEAMKAVAAEKKVGLVDLNASSVALAQELGQTRSLALANRPRRLHPFQRAGRPGHG